MYGVTYTQENNSLNLDKHDCGLLSNATVIMNSLLLLHQTISEPVKVLWPFTSIWNKSDRINRNVYELYFKTINRNLNLLKSNVYFYAMMGDCSKFNFSDLAAVRDTYFNLSDEVKNREQFFIDKYKIDVNSTIAILYRGTDKILEVPKVDPQYYLKCLSSIRQLLNYKILLQTDQQQILDYFNHQVKNQLFHIEEMPVTEGDRAIHNLSIKKIENYELGINYLAVISILSKCKYVVFDTSNAGLWICILRGSMKNTCQIYPVINYINKIEG